MRNIRRVFALSAFSAVFALGATAWGWQDPMDPNLGPGGFLFEPGQGGAFGMPTSNVGLGTIPTSLLSGAALGPDAPGVLLMLVNLPAVQQELKLTDSQKLKLKELKEEQARHETEGGDPAMGHEPAPAPARDDGQPGRKTAAAKRPATPTDRKARGQGRNQPRRQAQPGGPPDDGQDPAQGGFGQADGFDPVAMIGQLGPRLRKAEAEMLKLLEPPQRDRLQEIGLQHEGVRAVARPEIGRKVNLSTAQANQVQGIATQLQASQLEMIGQQHEEFLQRLGPASPTQVDPRILQEVVKQAEQANQGMVKRAETAINRLLKPAQKEAIQKLQGEPFDLKSALAGKPLRRKPGEGEPVARGRRSNGEEEGAGNEAGTAPAEPSRPANRPQPPRATDAGKRPSAINRP